MNRGNYSKKEDNGFDEKLLDLRRVTRVMAGGKRFSFRATVVIGNRQGKVGVGVAKGKDVAQSIQKAKRVAEKSLITVSVIKGTIPHEVRAKYCASEILLKPGREGHGLVAGGPVRVVCDLAGIKNLSAKILGRTPNKLTNARATLEALKKIKIMAKKEEPVKEMDPVVKEKVSVESEEQPINE
ncbi:MAG TPA: 30S ribosomal protein S5 [Candidatus Paceibacterota bacterium]|nr:30S ribosomal protein S5 [Candidatus Paceibacterota bacterium]